MTFSTKLSNAERERLALLLEECGEVIKLISGAPVQLTPAGERALEEVEKA
jgi:hypothetical protein